MTNNGTQPAASTRRSTGLVFGLFVAIGALSFIVRLAGAHPERAWQAYLVNFLLFSAIAQGGLLFSAIMHTVKARWTGPLSNLSEAFSAFFPVSFVLFLLLFMGKNYVFPWLHEDLHGKEVWLNLPFLFSRDFVGLLVLYGFGFAYLFHALWFKLDRSRRGGRVRSWLLGRWDRKVMDAEDCRRRMGVFAILYILAFALILSLIGYDLVMAADPHWYSTLFGAYSFVKAFYVGLGGLIILAAVLHLHPGVRMDIRSNQFLDVGKLFFAFCLVWADFFYCQFLVIWYGNIPEETAYVLERTLRAPWSALAWTVFIVSFVAPFLILINRRIKTRPKAMVAICAAVITGIWLEHFLLLGPAFQHGSAAGLPFSILDPLMALGFFGLMALALTGFLRQFPELLSRGKATPAAAKEAA
ncbi:MAG: hypothetical protein LJE65_10915 [Desulfobacteraceae bacterium]|nr:hypothetical protein [Desulfobacteraceae bacterium]